MPAADRRDTTVAALFVERRGVYAGQRGVELWDESRDARRYSGPWPVVTHPPCARWSRLAGLVEAIYGIRRCDDGGLFAVALHAVHTFGGVLEHPAFSLAWPAFDLPRPPTNYHGWVGDLNGGWSTYIEQGRYGAPDVKPTWLYAYGVELPTLRWGHCSYPILGNVGGRHRGRRHGLGAATPPEFRDVLLQMARSAALPR